MIEAVPLGELLHEEAIFGQKGGSTPRTLIPVWTLPLRHISSSLGAARPFTNKVEKGWKNVQTLWWAELVRLHSMTRAHLLCNPLLFLCLQQKVGVAKNFWNPPFKNPRSATAV